MTSQRKPDTPTRARTRTSSAPASGATRRTSGPSARARRVSRASASGRSGLHAGIGWHRGIRAERQLERPSASRRGPRRVHAKRPRQYGLEHVVEEGVPRRLHQPDPDHGDDGLEPERSMGSRRRADDRQLHHLPEWDVDVRGVRRMDGVHEPIEPRGVVRCRTTRRARSSRNRSNSTAGDRGSSTGRATRPSARPHECRARNRVAGRRGLRRRGSRERSGARVGRRADLASGLDAAAVIRPAG